MEVVEVVEVVEVEVVGGTVAGSGTVAAVSGTGASDDAGAAVVSVDPAPLVQPARMAALIPSARKRAMGDRLRQRIEPGFRVMNVGSPQS